MNTDQIIEFALQADAYADAMDIGGKNRIGLRDEYFASLVRNATLEECASKFEGQYTDSCPGTNISAAIRAMKEQA